MIMCTFHYIVSDCFLAFVFVRVVCTHVLPLDVHVYLSYSLTVLRNVLAAIIWWEKSISIRAFVSRTDHRECGQAQFSAYKPAAVSNFALTVSMPLADCDERPKMPSETAVGG